MSPRLATAIITTSSTSGRPLATGDAILAANPPVLAICKTVINYGTGTSESNICVAPIFPGAMLRGRHVPGERMY